MKTKTLCLLTSSLLALFHGAILGDMETGNIYFAASIVLVGILND